MNKAAISIRVKVLCECSVFSSSGPALGSTVTVSYGRLSLPKTVGDSFHCSVSWPAFGTVSVLD